MSQTNKPYGKNDSISRNVYIQWRKIPARTNGLHPPQTYPIHEIIVCDDCSTDGTMNILQEYATKFPFIKVHRNTRNKGCNQNFHDILVDYIAISDQDDIWFPKKIGTEENCPSISHIPL